MLTPQIFHKLATFSLFKILNDLFHPLSGIFDSHVELHYYHVTFNNTSSFNAFLLKINYETIKKFN